MYNKINISHALAHVWVNVLAVHRYLMAAKEMPHYSDYTGKLKENATAQEKIKMLEQKLAQMGGDE